MEHSSSTMAAQLVVAQFGSHLEPVVDALPPAHSKSTLLAT